MAVISTKGDELIGMAIEILVIIGSGNGLLPVRYQAITIGLEYQVFLNFYVIYRSTVICKLSLHIFGNLIAHWLLASQGSFTPDARVSLGVFFVLEWVLNGCMWLLAEGIPTDEINQWNG